MNNAQFSGGKAVLHNADGPYSLGFTNGVLWVVIFVTTALFVSTNLPWNLDDYDQAKQAFVSYQVVDQHRFFFPTTPVAGSAGAGARHSAFHNSGKPPAVGWVSAALFELTRSWEIAWRLPSFLTAALLAFLLYHAAKTAFGYWPALIALAAIGLNMLSARLATLVRTDMPLALFAFAIGLLFFEKIRIEKPWSSSNRVLLFLLLLGAMFIKGPIVWAFVLPPLLLYQFVRSRRNDFPSIWSGWWPWLASFGLFLGWAAIGIRFIPGFYDDVVRVEFLGRFHEGVHRSQPLFFYLPHLLQKFAPWSLLIIGLLFFTVRDRKFNLRLVRMSPMMFWLVAWVAGAIVVMSLIPSKRVDRIFPMIAPLCLLLAAQIHSATLNQRSRPWIGRLALGAIVFAFCYTGGYSFARVYQGYRTDRDALVKFGREVRSLARAQNLNYEVVTDKRETVDEGLLLYLQRPRFIPIENARELWNSGALHAVVAPESDASEFTDAQPALTATKIDEPVRRYVFLVRAQR